MRPSNTGITRHIQSIKCQDEHQPLPHCYPWKIVNSTEAQPRRSQRGKESNAWEPTSLRFLFSSSYTSIYIFLFSCRSVVHQIKKHTPGVAIRTRNPPIPSLLFKGGTSYEGTRKNEIGCVSLSSTLSSPFDPKKALVPHPGHKPI